jgi:hypothetical protein
MSTWILIAVFLFDGRLDTQRIDNIPSAAVCEDLRFALSAPISIPIQGAKSAVVGVNGRCLEKRPK